uniref:Serine/threonine-protein kinase HT1-like n=1 Tax=Rhizophora mucronata TaxID=61149 RepID=A0A2P2L6J1_RHIMU
MITVQSQNSVPKFPWQLYSTVTLRQGEKKHYNNKVDVYSFGIVLWELLTNRMPFEGMSNLQAAYAAAFKVFFWFSLCCIMCVWLQLLYAVNIAINFIVANRFDFCD